MLSELLSTYSLVLLACVCLILSALWFVSTRSSQSEDSRESITLRLKIPIIGHAPSLLMAKTSLPIYAFKVFGHTIYVVNSPELVAAIDHNAQDLSFAPYLVLVVARALQPSEDTIRKLSINLDGRDFEPGLRISTQRAMRESLALGTDALDVTHRESVQQVSHLIDVRVPPVDEPVGLFYWIRDLITTASTNAIYGRGNPFLDREVADGFWFWAFDRVLGLPALRHFPKVTVSGSYYGRKTVAKGFVEYFKNQCHEQGSPLVKARFKANSLHDVSLEDHGRLESSLVIALLVNTAPATFWTVFHLFSNPALLLNIRTQLNSIVRSYPENSDTQITEKRVPCLHVDMAKVMSECPLVKSLVEEVLRVRSANASGLTVMRNTLLNDQYLLRANSTVLIPSPSIHQNSSIWGTTVEQFDPYQFMKDDKSRTSLHPAYAYRALGGGAALCPGRFLLYLRHRRRSPFWFFDSTSRQSTPKTRKQDGESPRADTIFDVRPTTCEGCSSATRTTGRVFKHDLALHL